MPILYVCLINQRRTVVSEGLGTKIVGNFKQQILNNYDKFDRFGRKQVHLDSELSLSYRDQKSYAVACIANSYDIKGLEAQKYLEKVEELILEHLNVQSDMESQGSQRKPSIVQDYVGSLGDKKKLAAIQQDSYDTQAADTLPEIGQLEFTHLQEAQYSSLFNKLRNKLDSFTKEWNADERNRDKTFNVFN